MGQDCFNDLVLHIHNVLDIDANDILDGLIVKYLKRIQMANILADQSYCNVIV